MTYSIIKVLITATLVVLISEIAKRSSLLGAVVASLPLTSILAMIWLHRDTGNLEQVSHLSQNIFWIVIPSLVFFLAFPLLVKWGWKFWPALGASIAITSVSYTIYIRLMIKLGIEI